MRAVAKLWLVAMFALAPGGIRAARAGEPVVVFAAASLKESLDAAAASFTAASGAEIKISYAASFALARQIEQGAPADIFASADRDTMDYAAGKKSIRPETRFDLLGNRLVVVVGKNAAVASLALTPEALSRAIGRGRVATGDVASVPVGKYAKAALEKLGLWSVVEPRLAMTDNVRIALSFVSRGEAELGIVYATDAAADPGVRIVAVFPADSHPPIVYPFALTANGRNPQAAMFLTFLRSDAARPMFEKQGFTVLE